MKPTKDPLGVSPSKGNRGTKRGKEKILLISVGIESTTSGRQSNGRSSTEVVGSIPTEVKRIFSLLRVAL